MVAVVLSKPLVAKKPVYTPAATATRANSISRAASTLGGKISQGLKNRLDFICSSPYGSCAQMKGSEAISARPSHSTFCTVMDRNSSSSTSS